MKHGRILIIAVIMIACIASVLCFSGVLGRKPFKKLAAEDIAAAEMYIIPPETTCTLDVEQTKELLNLLSEVRIYQRDDAWHEYNGQFVQFTLTMTDGSTVLVQVYNPFFIIDGVGYRTAYEPCEALNAFANQIAGTRFAE